MSATSVSQTRWIGFERPRNEATRPSAAGSVADIDTPTILRGGAWDGVTVVSKSGAFGPPSLLRDLLARNGLLSDRSD